MTEIFLCLRSVVVVFKIHIQTIGILVAEKSDLTAKLSQSIKQIERKQSEFDEIQGRLKASRERVEELEKSNQNSSSNAQKHELVCLLFSSLNLI